MREPESAEQPEDEHTYGINWLNLGETEHDSDSDSKCLLVQRKKIHMVYKRIVI